MYNFVLNLWLSQKFFVPLQAKSKTYGMRRTTEYITQLGGINIADQIVAVGTEKISVIGLERISQKWFVGRN